MAQFKSHGNKTFELNKKDMGPKGGKIPGTGIYHLKRGETVIPANAVKAMERNQKRRLSRRNSRSATRR